MSNLARFAFLLSIFAVPACGGRSSASDDTSSGGSSAAGTGSGTGGTGVSGAATTCAKYEDDSPIPINVEISNMTNAPIFLGEEQMTCSTEPLFQVADARGGRLPGLGSCRIPCGALRTGGVGGCLAFCVLPSAVMLQPGETRSTTWDGLFGEQNIMSVSCASAEWAGVSCDVAKRIARGTYLFSARAGTDLDCTTTTASGACPPCQLDGNGGCVASGALIKGEVLTARATVLLDESYGVSGTSAGNPSPGDDSSGAAFIPAVTLVFTNP